jgi:hypothetical protein
MFSHISRVIAIFLIIMPAMAALAEQRALLVGVGKYSVPGIDLPGIDLDLERMQDTLNLMGFDDSQIHSLLDDKATSKNVFRELEIWLRQDVKPEDRVVFYFSGHGSNTPDLDGDESDGVDEVLVTHDVRRVRRDGRAALTGVVTDDKLSSLIAAIPSENVWIIVDACHSGTVSRGVTMDNLTLGTDPVFVKSFTYTGMPEGKQFVFDREFQKDGESNFVSISAAADGEKAIGTSSGGVFTIGLTETIADVAKAGGVVTVNQLRDSTATYIRDHVDANRVHNPQVNGSEALAGGTLEIVSATAENGPNRKRLIKLVAEQQNEFTLESSKSTYVVDDPVEFTLEIPIDGYLNVVTVDSRDDATVLYPNQFNPENTVKQGIFRFPTDEASFTLPASEPLGPTLVAAFVTQDPINFYTQTLDDRDEHGKMFAEMLELSVIAKD